MNQSILLLYNIFHSRIGRSVEDLSGSMTMTKNNQPSELLQEHQLKFLLLQTLILLRYMLMLDIFLIG